MRGGAIPVLAWSLLLAVLFVGNWIWEGGRLVAAEAAFGALIILAFAGLLAVMGGRRALRRGPPCPREDPQPAPQGSLAAVVSGLSIACILFGFVWAIFLVYFGAAVLLLSLGRLAFELRSERESIRAIRSQSTFDDVDNRTTREPGERTAS